MHSAWSLPSAPPRALLFPSLSFLLFLTSMVHPSTPLLQLLVVVAVLLLPPRGQSCGGVGAGRRGHGEVWSEKYYLFSPPLRGHWEARRSVRAQAPSPRCCSQPLLAAAHSLGPVQHMAEQGYRLLGPPPQQQQQQRLLRHKQQTSAPHVLNSVAKAEGRQQQQQHQQQQQKQQQQQQQHQQQQQQQQEPAGTSAGWAIGEVGQSEREHEVQQVAEKLSRRQEAAGQQQAPLLLSWSPESTKKPEVDPVAAAFPRGRRRILSDDLTECANASTHLSALPRFDFVDGHKRRVYSDTEFLSWSPQPGRYLVPLCNYGRLSNQRSCLDQYLWMAAALNRTLVIPKASLLSHFNWSIVVDVRHMQRCLKPHNGPAAAVLPWDEFLAVERRHQQQQQQQLGPPAGWGVEGIPPSENVHGRRRRRLRLAGELDGGGASNTLQHVAGVRVLAASQPVHGSGSETTAPSLSLANTSLSTTSNSSTGTSGGRGSNSRSSIGNIPLLFGSSGSSKVSSGSGGGGQSKVVLERIVCIEAQCWNPLHVERSMASMPELAFPKFVDKGMMGNVASSLDGNSGRCMSPTTFASMFGGLSERVLSFGNMYRTPICIDWYRWSRAPIRTSCADRVPPPPHRRPPPPPPPLPAPPPSVPSAATAAAAGAGIGPNEALDEDAMGSCSGDGSTSTSTSTGSDGGGAGTCCCNLWRPPDDLQQLAFRLRRERMPSGPYLAAHVRRGDFVKVHASTLLGLEDVARFLASRVVELQLPGMYLASDSKPDDMDHLKHIIAGLVADKGWNVTVIAFHDLMMPVGSTAAGSTNSSSFQLHPPPRPPPPPRAQQQEGEASSEDEEGPAALTRLVAVEGSVVAAVVDRLMCTEATVFVATAHSTFSRDIVHARSTDGRTTCADTEIG